MLVRELQRNGRYHIHALVDTYLDFYWVQRLWERCGGGRQVNVKFVSAGEGCEYVTKYLVKPVGTPFPRGARRFSSSRGLSLMVAGAVAVGFSWRYVPWSPGRYFGWGTTVHDLERMSTVASRVARCAWSQQQLFPPGLPP